MTLQLLKALPLLGCLSFIQPAFKPSGASPLSGFSSKWDDPKYLQCNTAANVKYMNEKEKELIYILNLLRSNPGLFANTVVQQYPKYIGMEDLQDVDEYRSLLVTLGKLKPLPLLYPDSLCYASAQCHAYSSGQSSYVGHERKDKDCEIKEYFDGECCDYGHDTPLAILMSLLIDEDVPTLGHREICLNLYKKIAVSIQPHKSYETIAVLDFLY